MAKLIENTVILFAGAFLFTGAAIAIGLVFLYVCGLVLTRRLKAAVGFPALTAGG
jgi:hypothetical protein